MELFYAHYVIEANIYLNQALLSQVRFGEPENVLDLKAVQRGLKLLNAADVDLEKQLHIIETALRRIDRLWKRTDQGMELSNQSYGSIYAVRSELANAVTEIKKFLGMLAQDKRSEVAS